MGHEDIHEAIASALDELEERDSQGRTRLAHGHHIIEQYAAIWREEEFHDAESSAEVAISIDPRKDDTGAAGTSLVSLPLGKRVLALLQR